MKKATSLLFLSIVTLFVFYACKKNSQQPSETNSEASIPEKFSQIEKQTISDFLKSTEYGRISGTVTKDFGSLDLNNSFIEYLAGDSKKPIYNFVFSSYGIKKSIIQVIPIPALMKNVLPNDDRYAMLLVDYRNYNTISKSGNILMSDLNYDNTKALSMVVENRKIKDAKAFTIPQTILSKYPKLATRKELGNPVYNIKPSSTLSNYCDQNGNGNVSYFECLGCGLNACGNNFECLSMCSLIELASVGSCVGSMAVACVYVAIVY
jgi:hypothetical protein